MSMSMKANKGLEMLEADLGLKKVRLNNTNKMKWRVYISIILIVSVYLTVTAGVLTNNTLIRNIHANNNSINCSCDWFCSFIDCATVVGV